MIWLLLLIVYLFFSVLRPEGMLSIDTVRFIVYASVPLTFFILAEGVIMIAGEFDISLVGQVSFIAMGSAKIITTWNLPGPLSLFVPILLGIFAGLTNGYLVGKRHLPPLLVTLGTLMLFEGLTLVISIETIYQGIPSLYLFLGSDFVASILLLAVSSLVIYFILRHTSLGVHIYAVGGDSETSRMVGINVENTKLLVFIIAGFLAGFGALLITGFAASVSPNVGSDWLPLIFAGAIFGGVSNGRGSILDLLAGGIFIGTIEAGLVMFNVSPPIRTVAFGLMVVISVILNQLRTRIRDATLKASRSDNN